MYGLKGSATRYGASRELTIGGAHLDHRRGLRPGSVTPSADGEGEGVGGDVGVGVGARVPIAAALGQQAEADDRHGDDDRTLRRTTA